MPIVTLQHDNPTEENWDALEEICCKYSLTLSIQKSEGIAHISGPEQDMLDFLVEFNERTNKKNLN